MQYSGGKAKQAKKIAAVLSEHRKPGQPYLEPFCGAFSVGVLMDDPRCASDVDEDIVALLQAVGQGWQPPDMVTEEQYDKWKEDPSQLLPAMRAFVGFGCSFGVVKWSRYAKGKQNYALSCRRTLLAVAERLSTVEFSVRSYEEWEPDGMLVYCDPPYVNTSTGVVHGTYHFNPYDFWDLIRDWSKHNDVFVTERMVPSRSVELVYEWSRSRENNGVNVSRSFIREALYRVLPSGIGI